MGSNAYLQNADFGRINAHRSPNRNGGGHRIATAGGTARTAGDNDNVHSDNDINVDSDYNGNVHSDNDNVHSDINDNVHSTVVAQHRNVGRHRNVRNSSNYITGDSSRRHYSRRYYSRR